MQQHASWQELWSPNQAAKLKVAGMRQGGRDKEGGETLGLQQRQAHALPATHTSTASSSCQCSPHYYGHARGACVSCNICTYPILPSQTSLTHAESSLSAQDTKHQAAGQTSLLTQN